MTPPELQTERLRLRGFCEGDLDVYAAMMGDAPTVQYLGGKTMTRAEAWRNMALVVGHWTLRGFGFWAVEEKASGALIGRVGLWYPEGWPAKEVGWTILRERWGEGFAPEAARAARDYFFRTQPDDALISVIHVENAKSMAVAQKIGETPWRDEEVMGFPCRLFRITRREWQALA